MNFGEFPRPVCAPLKPRHNPIDYPGTANVSCAHRMREPNSNCRYMKQFYSLRKSTEIDPNEELEARELVRLNRRFAFEKRTDKRLVKENVRRQVEQGRYASRLHGLVTEIPHYFFFFFFGARIYFFLFNVNTSDTCRLI